MINELEEYFNEYNIITNEDEEFLMEENNEYYPMYSISYNTITCISFYILKNYVLIDIVKKCRNESTRNLLQFFIDFFKRFDYIKYIEIDADNSTLNIKNIDISLKYLSLLIYGQTYYNRLGFGKQSEEWSLFILKPFLIFLNDIGYGNINKVIDKFNFDNNISISDAFNLIKINLNNLNIEDLILVKNIILYIFKRNKNICIFVPKINNNLKLYL